VEPELAALLRIEEGQKAMREELAAVVEALGRIEKLLAQLVQR